MHDIAGSMAYIEAEVIVKHATNAAGMGIILRGIEPGRAPSVLGIGATMKEGKLDYLEHPDQIPNDLIVMPGDDPRREAREGQGGGAPASCRASCWARSFTSTSCASSWAARSTSPARCAAWARPARCPS